MHLHLDATATGHFSKHTTEANRLGSGTPTDEEAFEWFRKALER